MKKMTVVPGLVLLLMSFAGHDTSAAGAAKEDLTVTVADKRVQGLSGRGLTLTFHIRVDNATSSPRFLVRYDYRVVVNRAEYLRLQVPLAEPIRIAPAGETTIALPLKITYLLLFQAVPGIENDDKAFCFITGTMVFADERRREEKIPVAASGEFPIFREPEAALLPVRVNNLTIGGADLVFQVRLSNGNSYELFVDAVRFDVSFGDHGLGGGEITGDKNIEPRGHRAFNLPFLINFFEVGKDVYGVLQGSAAACRFRGEVDVSTVWGKVTVPLDVRQTVPLLKST